MFACGEVTRVSDHDWAKALADQVRSNRAKQMAESQDRQSTWKLIEAKAPVAWEETRNRIRSKMLALNSALAEDKLVWGGDSKHVAKVQVGGGDHAAHAEATFNPKTFVIRIELANKGYELEPKMMSGRLYYCDHDSTSKSADQIAEEMIESLVKFI
jgi:hypothetical protein